MVAGQSVQRLLTVPDKLLPSLEVGHGGGSQFAGCVEEVRWRSGRLQLLGVIKHWEVSTCGH
jgi:hypothetical protein